MSGEAPRKRARLDAEDGRDGLGQSRTDGCTADAEFWFDDGNIILEAKGTQFKVYKGPLVEHSPFFRDMLSLPHHNSTEEPPAMRLLWFPSQTLQKTSGISSALSCPVNGFALRMYQCHTSPFIPPKRPFHAVSACIRLGHKYQIDGLVEEGLKYLRRLYPDNFYALEKRCPEEIPDPICAIAVVNIARLTGADYLLPVALVQCCELGSEIVEGFRREDGTREHLSSADLGRCFQAKAKLIEARVEAAFDIFDGEPSEYCEEKKRDADYLRALQADLPQGFSGRLCSPDVLERWWPEVNYYIPPLCSECDAMLKQADRNKQRELFHLLPALVGVEVDGWQKKNRKP